MCVYEWLAVRIEERKKERNERKGRKKGMVDQSNRYRYIYIYKYENK